MDLQDAVLAVHGAHTHVGREGSLVSTAPLTRKAKTRQLQPTLAPRRENTSPKTFFILIKNA